MSNEIRSTQELLGELLAEMKDINEKLGKLGDINANLINLSDAIRNLSRDNVQANFELSEKMKEWAK
jgi:hypothetical protein